MLKQLAAAILALLLAGNALAMLAVGHWWYGAVPGVTATGPFNPHFIEDIGAAYLVCAGALAWWATTRAPAPSSPAGGAMIAASAFLVLHAGIHLADAARGGHGARDLTRDLPGVFLPAVIAAWLAWPSRRE